MNDDRLTKQLLFREYTIKFSWWRDVVQALRDTDSEDGVGCSEVGSRWHDLYQTISSQGVVRGPSVVSFVFGCGRTLITLELT